MNQSSFAFDRLRMRMFYSSLTLSLSRGEIAVPITPSLSWPTTEGLTAGDEFNINNMAVEFAVIIQWAELRLNSKQFRHF